MAASVDAGTPPPPPPPPPTPIAVTWGSSYSSDAGGANSETTERAFNATYNAVSDAGANVWRLRVATVAGGADITVHTDHWRDAGATPPTTETEAKDAVTDMKGYYARGTAGSWHTEAASHAHENHHVNEWKCAGDHYWPATQTALEKLTAPRAGNPDAAAAVAAMKGAADAKIAAFKAIADSYWRTLSDRAGGRPYAAGQLALNTTIAGVQALARTKHWTVPAGLDTPSAANPCYQPWLAYSP